MHVAFVISNGVECMAWISTRTPRKMLDKITYKYRNIEENLPVMEAFDGI